MADPKDYRPTDIPELPGVYRFFDAKDKIIYVGKAKNLKNRLNSYFQSNLQAKTYRMVHTAVRVDWTVVKSELEALQLEFTWIKSESPKFNIQFKDDKSYPYLGVSLSEDFPRLFITRRRTNPKDRYFGPYAHAWALHATFDVLQKLFPIRSCLDSNFKAARRANRPCLLGEIGKCLAPCVDRVSLDEHKKVAQNLIKFVESDPEEVINELTRQMQSASDQEEFERAGRIRDQIHAIRRSAETAGTFLNEKITADFIALHEDITHAAVTLFNVISGRVVGSRSWIIDQTDVPEGDSPLAAAFSKIYSESKPPKEIYLSEEISDVQALEEFCSNLSNVKTLISTPLKGEKFDFLKTVKLNAHQALVQYLSKRSSDAAVSGKALEELAAHLDLPEIPLRIECFDISNTQGTNSVASMVVFEDGQPKKSQYRRFIIEGDKRLDDTRAMAQVLTRRLKRYLADKDVDREELLETGGAERFAYPPQLIIVDGGIPQVNAASRVMADLGISEIPLIGLAKRLEEVWFPQAKEPLMLPRHSESLYLIQRLRDEAHRFAITFHRSKRSKVMLESLLDEISGLGESRRQALLDKYGSVAAIKKASEEDLSKVPGIGARLAKTIFEHLKLNQTQVIDTETGEILNT
jgi:excinuclease ABC subunit C